MRPDDDSDFVVVGRLDNPASLAVARAIAWLDLVKQVRLFLLVDTQQMVQRQRS